MSILKVSIPGLSFIVMLLAIVGCNSEVDLDSLSAYDFDENSRIAEINCAVCHGSGKALDPLETGGSGSKGKHDKHVAERDYACGICHSGYSDAVYHMDGNLDTGSAVIELVAFDSTNPDGIWTPGAGSCSTTACHGADTVEWYGEDGGWTIPVDCAGCHSAATSSRRQVMGPGGDFDEESHHVIDYANRTTEIVTYNDCSVCHDQSEHMAGTVQLKDKDTAAVIVYDPENPASLEPFCLSCHDTDGASTEGSPLSPFSSSNTLGVIPNTAGVSIKSSWNKSNSHKNNDLTCTSCHGNTGQINAHGSSNLGLLTKGMNFLIDANTDYNEDDYELCFSCHANYPGVTKEDILGVKEGGNYDYELTIDPPMGDSIIYGTPPYYNSGVQTEFLDSDGRIHGSSSEKYQLHWFHISMRVRGSGDAWLYRGQGTPSDCSACHSSSIPTGNKATCTACHDVHGSNAPFGMVYDELMLSHDIDETKGILGIPRENLVNSPMNCGLGVCHSDPLEYTFDPTGE